MVHEEGALVALYRKGRRPTAMSEIRPSPYRHTYHSFFPEFPHLPYHLGHYVYFAFAALGTPLYVGVTGERGAIDITRRLNSHRRQSHWWPLTATLVVAEYSTGPAAAKAERRAIWNLGPEWNKLGNPRFWSRADYEGYRPEPLDLTGSSLMEAVRAVA